MTEETIWVSNIDANNVHGHRVKNLNSNHLANIINFLSTVNKCVHGHSSEEVVEIILCLRDEAKKRELSEAFLNAAPYPYNPMEPYIEYVGPRG